jgi:oligopeptide transport system substrate-binding protein
VAESWEQSPDGKEWTFHLRPNLKWSDGHPLNAHDFVWSYERMLSPDLAAEYASMLYPLKNAKEFNEGKIKDFNEVGVKAVDDLTLKLTLTGPIPYLLGVLKHYSWFPVPRHVIEQHGTMTDRENRWTRTGIMVSNGPFRLKEWRFSDSITLEKNPYYWDAAKVKLNGIKYYPISSDSSEERAFANGQLHATLTMPIPKIKVYRDKKSPFFHMEPQLAVYFYRINVTKPPLNDKRVRMALGLAIDRESLIENVTKGGQVPAVGLVPYPEKLHFPACNVMKFDVAEAKRLLAEAGYPNGAGFPKFEILINTNEGHRVIAEAIQEMWKRNLNIPVSIHNQDWGVYLESQRKLDYQICRAAWSGDYTDPFTFLSMWHTDDGNNETGWSNKRFDELMDGSMEEPNPDKRFQMLHEGEQILLDEVPIIPIYWYTHSCLVRTSVKNWKESLLQYRCYKAMELVPTPEDEVSP